jgi:GT2 family glycosyltransferase
MNPSAEPQIAVARGIPLPPDYAVCVVNYRNYQDLDRCLASLKSQSVGPSLVLVADCDGDPGKRAATANAHPECSIQAIANLGYAGAANWAIGRILAGPHPPDFILLLNADIRLAPGFAAELVREMCARSEVVFASGKLLRPDKITIDSAGFEVGRNRRFRDRGSGEADIGQYDEIEYVVGVSGAAMMIRTRAIPGLCIDGELFDTDFFAYHEDTDLAWRAQLLGWRSLYAPDALAIHRRGWRKENRFDVPLEVRRHSFKNFFLVIAKNDCGRHLLRDLPAILVSEAMRFCAFVLYDPAVLPAYLLALRRLPAAIRKRRVLRSSMKPGSPESRPRSPIPSAAWSERP